MEVILDGETHQSKVHGTYHQLDTSDTIMLGTANNNILVQDLTRGHFTQGFQVKFQDSTPCRDKFCCVQGCMRNISIMGVYLDTRRGEHLMGQNIQECANRRK